MKAHTPLVRCLSILILLALLLPMTPSLGLLASAEVQVPSVGEREALPDDQRLELELAQWDVDTVPVTQNQAMYLVVEVTQEPECYPPCVMPSPDIVKYILPRPEFCGTEPYPGDPDEIVWMPGQENVGTDFNVGDIVVVYGECWLDLGVYPAVSIPPDAPYFLLKSENLSTVFLPLVLNNQ